jgi:hypothetical protein
MARKKKGSPDRLHLLAEKEFGLTDDPAEAGFILSDGSMLDFSEKNDGGTPGTRSLDHRAICRVITDAGYTMPEGFGDRSLGMFLFMEETGAIRMMVMETVIFFQCGKTPTGAQVRRAAGIVGQYRPEMVELARTGSLDMVQIEPATPGRVRMVLEAVE